MTDRSTEGSADPEREFDDFARTAAQNLKRPAPIGGAELVQQAGERRRARTRAGFAAGALALAVIGAGAVVLQAGDDEEQRANPPATSSAATVAAANETDPATSEPTTAAAAASSTAASTTTIPTTTAAGAGPWRTIALAELPGADPIGTSASLGLDVQYAPVFGWADGESVWILDSESGALERHARADGSLIGTVSDVVPVGTLSLARPLVAFGSVWVPSATKVTRVDPDTMSVTATIPIPGSTIELGSRFISDIAADADGVWALSHVPGDVAVVKIDPTTDQLTERVPLGGNARSIAITDGTLWATHVLGDQEQNGFQLLRFDLATGEREAEIELPFEPGVAIVDGDRLWVNGNSWSSTGRTWVVALIDMTSDSLSSVTEIHGPNAGHFGLSWSDVAVAGGDAWVPTPSGLVRVDGDSSSVVARYGDMTGGGVIADGDAIWATDQRSRRLYRLEL